MSFNGSGTFVINTAGQPVVSGTVISSTAFNALTADLATGLSTCITKDGQTTPTANIPMGNNKITGLAVGTAATDAATLSQVQSTVAKLLASVSGTDTITAVASPTLAAYAAGQMFYFVAAGANTGAVTLNINSLGAKSVTRDGTTALASGDIQSGEVCVVVYDGTQFQLVNGASQSASIVTENLTVNKATVLNESGGDNDTRIEGDTDANLVFVDASADAVGIGTSSPATKLHVQGSAGQLLRVTDGTTGASIYSGSALFGFNNQTGEDGMFGSTASHFLYFATNGSEKLRLDSSGNLGLGVTPSAWNTVTPLQVKNASFSGTTSQAFVGNNWYYASGDKYISTAAAGLFQINGDVFTWLNAASGTAGNAITFTERMRLDASGNLGVGLTSPTVPIEVQSNSGGTGIIIRGRATANSGTLRFYANNGTTQQAKFEANDTVVEVGSITNVPLVFYANGTERARITSGGDFCVGTTSANFGKLTVSSSSNGAQLALLGASQTGMQLNSSNGTQGWLVGRSYSGNDQNDFFIYDIPNNRLCLFISTAGETLIAGTTDNGAYNLQCNGTGVWGAGAYVNGSDARLKDNIQSLDSGLDVVKAMRPVTFQYKPEHSKDQSVQPGFIAQELQEAMAGKSYLDGVVQAGPEYLNVAYQNIIPILVKAIQELEAKVAALEAK